MRFEPASSSHKDTEFTIVSARDVDEVILDVSAGVVGIDRVHLCTNLRVQMARDVAAALTLGADEVEQRLVRDADGGDAA